MHQHEKQAIKDRPASLEEFLRRIFFAYGIDHEVTQAQPFGNGLINKTWKVESGRRKFILQNVNSEIFSQPQLIANNVRAIADFIHDQHPHYLFVTPVQTICGEEMFYDETFGYFRLMPFIPDSHTIDVAESPEQAYEAAFQFGKFTGSLSGFDVNKLKITLHDFHNLSLRYQQFQTALKNGNAERIKQAQESIKLIKQFEAIVKEFERIHSADSFRQRVTHHDTKINNVLFDKQGKGICIIDLDTIMPGLFISDVGDMMRTYLSPVSEEESDFSKILIREDFYRAIVQGYNEYMAKELTDDEKQHFLYAGKFLIYMQAIRFLTDYLNNDKYYGAKYPEHNFVRANNQITLLQRLTEKEDKLGAIRS
ncbi:phosphotransferase enzyme family protein [Pinibacter soli]|uniref:Aminoglycoside phosphotransferase family protein n=1 Tax=Pinibacter soli TaxID=3044211 RepID=A0ABT6R9X1_9BACT|nr:aminoglycoside phosphotransferase family protein [Pinibacter soli]MDI3319358.1 aminoglycoside phosphotransferase family protein [Pinibacter soli]